MTDEYGRIHTDGSRSGGQPVVVTQKAHTMVLEVLAEWGLEPDTTTPQQLTVATTEALCRAIDQSEDLRRPQTDALKMAREDAIEACARVADAFNATPAFDLPCSPFDRTEAIAAAIRDLKGSK
jgi:hypothetical protein